MYRSVGKLLRSLTMVLLWGDVQGRGQYFEQVDRGAVGGHHFAGFGADHAGDFVAHALGQCEPAGGVPAPDEVLPPFACDCLGHAGRYRFGQRTKRVAIEVDDARGQVKLVAQIAQGVELVQQFAVFQGRGDVRHGAGLSIGSASSRKTARSGLALALMGWQGRAFGVSSPLGTSFKAAFGLRRKHRRKNRGVGYFQPS